MAELGGPIACIGLAVLLLARTRRNRIAGLGYAGVGTVLLAASLAPANAAELGAAIGGLLVCGPLLAWLFRREPWLVAYGTLAFIPLRVGFLGHSLLVPLYAVAVGAAGLLLWEMVDGDDRTRELGIAAWPLALYLVWISFSVAWTGALHTAATDLIAFYVPFTIIAISIARLPWRPSRIRLLYGELVAMALVFAATAFYQYETRTIFENAKLYTSNTYEALFRVNSVFFDPSIYGRFLVVALVPTVVLIIRGRSVRDGVAALVFAAIAWLGLLVSFSQSSFAALFVAVLVASAVVWRWRALLVLGALVVALAGVVATQPKVRHDLTHLGSGSAAKHHRHPATRGVKKPLGERRHHHRAATGLNKATGGRATLIVVGIKIARAHAVRGVGLGGFERAYSKRTGKTPRQSASHATPVTVAAEEGAPGLLLYLWLVGALLLAAYRRINHAVYGTVALAAGLALLAVFVHSLAYSDFFEDPTTWGLIGLVALVSPRRVPARAHRPVEAADQRVPAMIAR
ncbi:MAG TPA: O-antigen ligase family protein [Gaiellaceae bacterium]|nr:O-antigen ligase family protein [Gaiellaceae bacterium]